MADRIIKAILIDVFKKEVREVSYLHSESNQLQPIYNLLNCECICSAENEIFFPINHCLYVDDEAFLHGVFHVEKDGQINEKFQGGFFIKISGHAYIGNGLILAISNTGDTLSHFLEVENIRKNILFF